MQGTFTCPCSLQRHSPAMPVHVAVDVVPRDVALREQFAGEPFLPVPIKMPLKSRAIIRFKAWIHTGFDRIAAKQALTERVDGLRPELVDVLAEHLQDLLVRHRRDVVHADVVVGHERHVPVAELELSREDRFGELGHPDHVRAELRVHP